MLSVVCISLKKAKHQSDLIRLWQQEVITSPLALDNSFPSLERESIPTFHALVEWTNSISSARNNRLLRDSRLIIFDESTAALDLDLDAKIQQTLREEFAERGVTVITIAHRLYGHFFPSSSSS